VFRAAALALDDEQAPSVTPTSRSDLVPNERLAGTAGDARIRGRAGAESRNGIPHETVSVTDRAPTITNARVRHSGCAEGAAAGAAPLDR
jgi:hypothetical protein